MCTAISYHGRGHFFGRNLDLEYSYEERICITPRRFPFVFRKAGCLEKHYAMIGMAYIQEGYPLYYDATNEKGLSMAGLLFAGNAYYGREEEGKDNVSPFELIPWILGQCETVKEARLLLERIQLVELHFNEKLQLTPMHWMVADREQCVVVEPLMEGLRIYDNPIGVLTNNPPFPYQMMQLNQYRGLSRKEMPSTFAEGVELTRYSRGMGAIGLPGDLSSTSRFVRAAFHKLNAEDIIKRKGQSEEASVCSEIKVGEVERENGLVYGCVKEEELWREKEVSQFFHLLGSVEMPWGSLELEEGVLDKTIYSSCCDTEKGIYYYRTYENQNVVGVDMWGEDVEKEELIVYELMDEKALIQNEERK